MHNAKELETGQQAIGVIGLREPCEGVRNFMFAGNWMVLAMAIAT